MLYFIIQAQYRLAKETEGKFNRVLKLLALHQFRNERFPTVEELEPYVIALVDKLTDPAKVQDLKYGIYITEGPNLAKTDLSQKRTQTAKVAFEKIERLWLEWNSNPLKGELLEPSYSSVVFLSSCLDVLLKPRLQKEALEKHQTEILFFPSKAEAGNYNECCVFILYKTS